MYEGSIAPSSVTAAPIACRSMSLLLRSAACLYLLLDMMVSARPAHAQGNLQAYPVVIASDVWCPHACDPSVDGLEGYMVEVAREVLEAAGFTVEYRLVNFQVLQRMVEDGTATAVPRIAVDPNGRFLLPRVPQGRVATAVAVRADQGFDWAGPQSLEARLTAVIRDYDYGGDVQGYIDANMDDPSRILVLSGFGYSHVNQGLRLVAAGRVDAFIDDVEVLEWGLERLKGTEPVRVFKVQQPADLFVGLSKMDHRAVHLARIISDGTEELRRSGRLAEILARYGLKDQGS